MSHSSGKDFSNKPKVERTAFGVKVIGMKSPSTSLESFAAGVLNDEPNVETSVPLDSVPVSESHLSDSEHDIVDTGNLMVVYVPQGPLKSVYPVPDSPQSIPVDLGTNIEKDGLSDATISEEVPLKRKKKSVDTPVAEGDVPLIISSDEDDSENVPLVDIARRMKKRVRVSAEDIPSSSVKKAKVGTGSSKSSKSLKKSKGKKMFVESSKRKRRKSTGSKKSVEVSVEKKGKASRVEADVEPDVQDIRSPERKKTPAGKHVKPDVRDSRSAKSKKSASKGESSNPIYFHSSECRDKWPFVTKRRIAIERAIGPDVKECGDVVALIERAGLMRTVSSFGRCFEHLVKEFITNLSAQVGVPGCAEFRKVFIRNRVVVFSPGIINSALERSEEEFEDGELALDSVAEVLTAGQVLSWPPKKLLPTGLLSVKYAILSRIGMLNWIPSHHTSAISVSLAKLIFRIGTGMEFDFGAFVFEQTLKHAVSRATKLPISFPSLLTEIILRQHPDILKDCDVSFPRGVPITLDHRLFQDPHVLDIVLPASRTSVPTPLTGSGSKSAVNELEDLSRELQELIRVTTARKEKVDSLILKLKEGADPESVPSSVESEGSSSEEDGEDHSVSEASE